MKLTKTKLQQIIKEEHQALLTEDDNIEQAAGMAIYSLRDITRTGGQRKKAYDFYRAIFSLLSPGSEETLVTAVEAKGGSWLVKKG